MLCEWRVLIQIENLYSIECIASNRIFSVRLPSDISTFMYVYLFTVLYLIDNMKINVEWQCAISCHIYSEDWLGSIRSFFLASPPLMYMSNSMTVSNSPLTNRRHEGRHQFHFRMLWTRGKTKDAAYVKIPIFSHLVSLFEQTNLYAINGHQWIGKPTYKYEIAGKLVRVVVVVVVGLFSASSVVPKIVLHLYAKVCVFSILILSQFISCCVPHGINHKSMMMKMMMAVAVVVAWMRI